MECAERWFCMQNLWLELLLLFFCLSSVLYSLLSDLLYIFFPVYSNGAEKKICIATRAVGALVLTHKIFFFWIEKRLKKNSTLYRNISRRQPICLQWRFKQSRLHSQSCEMCGVESSLDIDNVEIDPAEVRRWNSACVWVLSWIFDCDHAPFELSTVAGAWGMDMGDPVWSSYIALECSIFFAAMHRTSLRKCLSYLHERMMLELMHHHRFEVFCFDWWWSIGTNERLQRIKSLFIRFEKQEGNGE